MKKLLIALIPTLALACDGAPNDPVETIQSALSAGGHRVIVTGRPGTHARLRGKMAAHGGAADVDTGHVVAGFMPDRAAAARLASDPDVLRVEDDVVVSLSGKPAPPPPPAQTTPWGITRIGAAASWGATTGLGVKVAVIDTSIDGAHADLSANFAGCVNFTNEANCADGNGHGTHVAGTIAAAQNAIGVVGAAHGARLYAVKVLTKRGSGWMSWIIAGIDWSVANGMQVANMSLGSSSDVQALEDACDRALAAGVVVVAAGGNSGDGSAATDELDYPGAYDSVLAVAATDASDAAASWSSTNAFIDLAAPGVSIPSTWKGGGYGTMSGTSMASPHVAGSAALLRSAYPGMTAACVRTHLRDTATDLGPAGTDPTYGRGIVNVPAALSAAASTPCP